MTLYGVFTNPFAANGPSRCLLLELLDVSVSELLFYSSQQGCSMWMIQHCARDALEALSFLHHKGYVHADLKPRNILWSAEEECFKLIDFGLSFKEGNQDVKYIQTDGYRAPEAELQNSLAQAGFPSETECTSAVDLWSLGIVLLEMFSGMKLKHTVQSQEWKANSSAIIDHIFASDGAVNSAIPAYHLRDLIKRYIANSERADPSRLGLAFGCRQSCSPCRSCLLSQNCPVAGPDSSASGAARRGGRRWELGGRARRNEALPAPLRMESVGRNAFPGFSLVVEMEPLLAVACAGICPFQTPSPWVGGDPGQRASAAKALGSPFFSIPFAPHIEDLVMLPTPVLRLLNVLSDACLQSEEEYDDVLQDIREECQKYGPVVSMLVPKENPGKGQVFVEYTSAGDAKAAQKLLTGRVFDGKFVVATFYPLSAYKRGYLYQTLL
nr:serine/threonine-protein kinase Kist [Pelodiscus sinensis]|eukprot:XP_014436161.1 serine/threonine-protein kinase Kist [Pelodiscus sinensis]